MTGFPVISLAFMISIFFYCLSYARLSLLEALLFLGRDIAMSIQTFTDDTVERQQELLGLVNAVNEKSLTLNDVTIGAPQPLNYANRNTSVVLSGKQGTRYSGDKMFYYNRIPLTMLGYPTLASETAVTPDALLSLLNAEVQADLQLTDLEPVVIPNVPDAEVGTVTLTAKATAIKWSGNTKVDIISGLSDFSQLHTFVHTTLPSLV
jgi:hypothetical protein